MEETICPTHSPDIASLSMLRTRIKICGITRPQDAALACRLGADAIGMVFHQDSRRCVPLETARRIMAAMDPFTTPVGLFVDAPTQAILDIAQALHLKHIQLHGHESPQQITELRGLCIVKAIRVESGRFGQTLQHWRQAIEAFHLDNLKGLVLETAPSDGDAPPGGSGNPNDWKTIAHHQQLGDTLNLPPLIAAGGLTPQNVAAVIGQLRPFAVDVSSGVESRIGEKSEEKLRAFILAMQSIQSSENS